MSAASMRAAADGFAYLAFPSVPLVFTPVPVRNVSCCALLRLENGTAWFLKTTGQPWTEERARAAGAVLASHGVPGMPAQQLEERIARAVGSRQIAIQQPVLTGADAAVWDFRRTAVALMARSIQYRPGVPALGEAAQEVSTLERQFQSDLDPAVRQFAAALDPEAIVAATVDGRVDTALYNYLVREPGRAWRMQFAHTFPLFLRAAATGDASSAGATLRQAVDAGVPLVNHLARVWAVRPGAVRCLIGRSPLLVGARWEADPRTLVRLLDQLRPEDRPGEDPGTWARLGKGVDIAERIFRCPITASFLAMAWLRSAARNRFLAIETTRRGRGLSAEAMAAIDSLRGHLIDALARMAAGDARGATGEPRVAAATVADRRLAGMNPGRLASAAIAFAREHARLTSEYEQAKADFERESRLRAGDAYWPLMPDDFSASDGALRVVALTSREALMQQGTRMALCIRGGGELAATAAACAQARAFLVAVVEVSSGSTQSVAEFRVRQPFRGGRYELDLVQHKGFGNRAPSPACVKAVHELTAQVRNREIQEHLEAGRRLAHRRSRKLPMPAREAEHGIAVQALRSALGAALFDGAAGQVAESAWNVLGS